MRRAVLIGFAIMIATWPVQTINPLGGLDPSWHAAIVMAHGQGIHWGSELVFTYGPLGFLRIPELYEPGLALAAWLFALALRCVVVITITWAALRAGHPTWFGVGLAIVGGEASAFIGLGATIPLVLFALGVALVDPAAGWLGGHRGRTLPLALATAFGAVGALTLLVKLNDGIAALGVGLIMAVGLGASVGPGGKARGAIGAGAVFVAVAAATFIGAWLVAGQRLLDIPAFVETSFELVAGYSGAMGVETAARGWEYPAAALVAVVAVGATARATARLPGIPRATVITALTVIAFLTFKHTFVRHNSPNGGFFASVFLCVAVFLPWRTADRVRQAVAVGVIGAVMVAAFGVAVRDRADGPGRFLAQVTTLSAASLRTELADGARQEVRGRYDIPTSMLAEIGASGVDIRPYDAAVAWAYPELRWAPLPVIQSYTAYTPTLDRLNAAALRAVDGPPYVLVYRTAPIDQRDGAFEVPETSLALACAYAEVEATESWQLLERVGDRCGPPQPLVTLRVRPGDVIPVPAAPGTDRFVVGHIEGLEADVGARLRAALWKSPIWSIWFPPNERLRLVPGTASGPLIFSAPAALVDTVPFMIRTATKSFQILIGPAVRQANDPLPDVLITVRFESIPLLSVAPTP